MTRIRRDALVVCLALLLCAQFAIAVESIDKPPSSSAALDAVAPPPRTNAERRQDGVKHNVAPWLTASLLVDLEWQQEEFSTMGGGDDSVRTHSANFQLGLIASPWEHVQAELDLEYDTATRHGMVDEAFVTFEQDPWDLSIGKLYTPLGQYISHFPSGPLLEFGETQAHAIGLSYSPNELFDLSLTAYHGHARELGHHPSKTDWSVAVTTSINDDYVFGLSYQSDLADANSALLADSDNRYQHKVAAASGLFVWMTEDFELSFEVLGALDSFRELESDRDQPLAWNLEFASSINSQLEWALRAAGSRELEGEPEWQLGAAVTWNIYRDVRCSVEYLHGHFRHGLATDQANEPSLHVDSVGLKVSIGF